jgi:N-acetylneuraminic acid mutarotase
MKINSIFLFLLFPLFAMGQVNTWTQVSSFGGGNRSLATSFSIGSKAYVLTGGNSVEVNNDLWEYDSLTNVWTQKTSFPGSPREAAVAFSIGTKGYVGTGLNWSGTYYKDFWEYNSVTDSWVQKADFGGTARYSAVGFSIGSKGYIGTGADPNRRFDFWEYDTLANTWTQRSPIPGSGRYAAVGFSIGNKGYMGGGTLHWERLSIFGSLTRHRICGPKRLISSFRIRNMLPVLPWPVMAL